MRYRALILIVALAGCITKPGYIPTTRYVVTPVIQAVRAEATRFSLGIRPLDAARPYKLQMAFRDEGQRLAYYDHAEWAELPSDVVTQALFDAIEATGRFTDVAYAYDVGAPDLVLIGRIRSFEEVRTEKPLVAACEVRLELRAGIKREAIWSKTLAAREPLEESDPSGLAAAMSRAVARIANEAAAAIAAAPVYAEELGR